jgi:hypothetical protein
VKFERNEATDEMHFAAASSISLRGGPVRIARNPAHCLKRRQRAPSDQGYTIFTVPLARS